MKKFMLQYISQGKTPEAHIQNIETVCKAGGRWIQLRMKAVTEEVYLTTALQVRAICTKYNAVFIVNDSIDIALKSNADGVHVGKEDESPLKARAILGASKIIGGTANTLTDCQALVAAKVDYIGLGPYRFTITKENLSPVLGLHGYQKILEHLNTSIPIIAIGGIYYEDVSGLVDIGVSGVAVSGILSSENPEVVRKNINLIEEKAYETITNSR